MITTQDIFVGELNIPLSLNDCSIDENLQWFIDEYEPIILQCLLGGMYGDFIDGLAQDPVDQKWIDLRDGADFQLNGVTITFRGLKHITARYIYWFYMADLNTLSSSTGEVKPKYESATRAAHNRKMVSSWRKMIDMIGFQSDTCGCLSLSYKTCKSCEYKPTLYNFLTAGDYDNWSIGKIETRNILGI